MFLGGGDFLDIFPANGIGQIDSSMSFLEKLWTRTHHLILPVICFTYGSLAFLSRQMRGAMINTLSQDYIRTAKAKGLDNETVLWKHGLKKFINSYHYIICQCISITY
jgi:peptide/nickel transport system permease protein